MLILLQNQKDENMANILQSDKEKLQCVIYFKILAEDSMKLNKLKIRPVNIFAEKITSFEKQKSNIHKILTVNESVSLASYKVAYKIIKREKPHTIAELLILSVAIDIAEMMFDESYVKQLKNIPLSNDIIWRRIIDISVAIQRQFEFELVEKLFAIQLNEAVDSNNRSPFIFSASESVKVL